MEVSLTLYYTDSTGLAEIVPVIYTALGHESDISVYYALSTPKWSIVRNQSTGPILEYVGTIGGIWFNRPNPATFCLFLTSESNEYEIHRALDYYFNSVHELTDSISLLETPVTVRSCTYTDQSHPNWAAVTWGLSKLIEVYDYPCDQNITLCNVFHELGHVRQCWHHPVEYADTLLIPHFIRESYAGFVGWSVGWSYYQSNGFVRSFDAQQINWDGRQTWTRSSGSNYSPLFVDLNDRFNQWTGNHRYVYDAIQDVPLDFIDRAGLESLTFDDCAQYLRSHSGTYYTLSEINTYLENYE